MKLLLVVNPVSGDRDKAAFLDKATALCQRYGIDLDIFETTGSGDREAISQRVEGAKNLRVAVGGGDGTLNLVASALLHRDIPLGIIPLGSANGMARELKVAHNPQEALRDLLLSQRVAPLDVLLVNDRHLCLHIGDVGLNAKVVHAFEQDTSRGLKTYAKHFLQQLTDLTPFSFSIQTHQGIRERHGVMLGICNARTFGTGLHLNNLSNPFDGAFELVIVEKIRVEALLKAGLSTLIDSLADNFDNEVISTREAQIGFESDQLLQLDGEIIGRFSQLDIKMLPAALPLLTHAGNPYLERPAEPLPPR